MNYPYYRRQGWCCSSAVIESARKQILGGRIKGSGRRWNVAGANAMITLRCAFANGEENVLCEQQHQDNVLKLERLMNVPIMKPALPVQPRNSGKSKKMSYTLLREQWGQNPELRKCTESSKIVKVLKDTHAKW